MYSLTWDGDQNLFRARRIRIPATYLDKESDSLTAIQEAVVVGESEVHHLLARISIL
jgi:hypothetical protein